MQQSDRRSVHGELFGTFMAHQLNINVKLAKFYAYVDSYGSACFESKYSKKVSANKRDIDELPKFTI